MRLFKLETTEQRTDDGGFIIMASAQGFDVEECQTIYGGEALYTLKPDYLITQVQHVISGETITRMLMSGGPGHGPEHAMDLIALHKERLATEVIKKLATTIN